MHHVNERDIEDFIMEDGGIREFDSAKVKIPFNLWKLIGAKLYSCNLFDDFARKPSCKKCLASWNLVS